MAHFGFSYRDSPYPSYWGEINSKTNFCEEDFILTRYIAEFINTLTNVTYVIYAIHGIVKNYGRKDAFLRNLPYLGIMGVGFGSTIFHASNKFYTQWFDDLSMLLAVGTVLHRVYTFDSTPLRASLAGLGLATMLIAFGVYHCVTDEVVMHSVVFGIMIVLVGIQTRSIIKHRIEEPAMRKEVSRLVTWGSVIFVSGYLIWNIDNWLCSSLTRSKRYIGMPISFLLELHGWWHILTGAGAYIFIALVEYLTSAEAGEPLAGRFAWPVDFLMGYPSRKAEKTAIRNRPLSVSEESSLLRGHGNENGNGNGYANENGNGNARKPNDIDA